MRRKQTGRPINGVLILDKPAGMTSNAALQDVKRLYDARKAGHTGSLDPLASGMLPICFGRATKFSQFLLDADKRYRVVGKLGIKTATGDAEGDIVEQHELKNITKEAIEAVLPKFRGNIEQIPSMYSAIKYQGQPLYKLARQGITIERKPRALTIHKLELLDFGKDLMDLEIHCSKGTYVRTLVEDIGDVLGCGAHVAALRRLTAGPYKEDQMITMAELTKVHEQNGHEGLDKLLLPISSMLLDWPEVKVSEAGAYYLQKGQAIISPYAPKEGQVLLVMKDGRFLGVGEITEDGKVAPRKIV